MSDTYFSGLYAVHEPYMSNCFGDEVSKLLVGRSIPKSNWITDQKQGAARYQTIGSRNMWFQRCMGEMVRRSGFTSLWFFSGESYTHTHTEITNFEDALVWKQVTAYTVLNPDYAHFIAEVEAFEAWCLKNPEKCFDVLGVSQKHLKEAYESAFFTLEPASEGLGEGDNVEFFFCVLRTFCEVMRFAKFNRCWAVYQTPLLAEACSMVQTGGDPDWVQTGV